MKIKLFLTLSILMFSIIVPQKSQAENQTANQKGSVQFEASLIPPQVIDPEFPEKPVDPGEFTPQGEYLRLDFAPQLNFGRNKLSSQDQFYSVNAQLFHGEQEARGNFVQVSDSRTTSAGWKLQVRQETAFTESKETGLIGAYLSLDKAWANSSMDQKYAPILGSEVVRIDKVGTTYNLANAEKGTGQGTWTIAFGASEENENAIDPTLKPAVDEHGSPILDPNFENKQVYKNKAVTLFVPGSVEKKQTKYQTVITWILSELP
ncbi:WxL domain-containing protein [Candidatus Enterococcus ikei]|uniref:WxL domain-containing protein n=1 Tax=Candidatus Enterococcus ikei TaxID=2815326 RepID=A0ABS3H3B3_9ENTE|nr:WxL domain-containing protein [Enterococcus sp. DIV0869a]MBO0441174.1 WxL domain-containing protein [Enterococcus sp. DIV0869a]